MADILFDPNPALRAELQAAFDTLDEDLLGLKDFTLIRSTPEFTVFMQQQFDALIPMWQLLKATLESLDAVIVARQNLAAAGYPMSADKIPMPPEIFAQLQIEMNQLNAAKGLFNEQLRAAQITVNLGKSEEKK